MYVMLFSPRRCEGVSLVRAALFGFLKAFRVVEADVEVLVLEGLRRPVVEAEQPRPWQYFRVREGRQAPVLL